MAGIYDLSPTLVFLGLTSYMISRYYYLSFASEKKVVEFAKYIKVINPEDKINSLIIPIWIGAVNIILIATIYSLIYRESLASLDFTSNLSYIVPGRLLPISVIILSVGFNTGILSYLVRNSLFEKKPKPTQMDEKMQTQSNGLVTIISKFLDKKTKKILGRLFEGLGVGLVASGVVLYSFEPRNIWTLVSGFLIVLIGVALTETENK